MSDALNNGTWPIVLTTLVAAICGAAAIQESRESRRVESPHLWPVFWWVSTGVLASLAVAQAADLGQLVANAARRRAADNNWYNERQPAQIAAIVVITAIWIAAAIALGRVRTQRRRYLPMALAVFWLTCFAVIRVVSLHQIDAVIYYRHIAGVEVGRLIEAASLALAMAVAASFVAGSRTSTS